jgi:sodium-dependent dicarboxylate transporter 2/3/5
MPGAFGKQRIYVSKKKPRIDTRRLVFICLGLGLFFWLYLIAPLADAVDPVGRHFPLKTLSAQS